MCVFFSGNIKPAIFIEEGIYFQEAAPGTDAVTPATGTTDVTDVRGRGNGTTAATTAGTTAATTAGTIAATTAGTTAMTATADGHVHGATRDGHGHGATRDVLPGDPGAGRMIGAILNPRLPRAAAAAAAKSRTERS